MSELEILRSRVAALEMRVEEWRQDAAARLETYIALMNSGLIGSATQVRVSLIMPSYAMLSSDETGEYFNPTDEAGDPIPLCTSNIPELLAKVRALLDCDSDEDARGEHA